MHADEPGLYFKLTSGNLAKVGPVGRTADGNPPNTGGSGSVGNAQGELWLDGRNEFSNPVMKVYSGQAWRATNGFEINDTTGDFTLGEKLYFRQDVYPEASNTVNLGSPSLRFANIYTGDLHLSNERGDWTMIEEEDYLSLRNNKNGKVFRLMMEEVES